ncbi:MAG: hypothetical protein GX117_01200, partial [Candidatus Hydrogenedentes bacterium]|nr:hypothetical protein [Candidatus Hydrogenedentota bacterium]
DDIQVRIEAYVFREPYDPIDIDEAMDRLGIEYQQDFNDMSRQMFRILDWKIVQ